MGQGMLSSHMAGLSLLLSSLPSSGTVTTSRVEKGHFCKLLDQD